MSVFVVLLTVFITAHLPFHMNLLELPPSGTPPILRIRAQAADLPSLLAMRPSFEFSDILELKHKKTLRSNSKFKHSQEKTL